MAGGALASTALRTEGTTSDGADYLTGLVDFLLRDSVPLLRTQRELRHLLEVPTNPSDTNVSVHVRQSGAQEPENEDREQVSLKIIKRRRVSDINYLLI